MVNSLIRADGRVLNVVGRGIFLVGGATAVLVTCLHREAIVLSAFPVGRHGSGASKGFISMRVYSMLH